MDQRALIPYIYVGTVQYGTQSLARMARRLVQRTSRNYIKRNKSHSWEAVGHISYLAPQVC